MIRFTPSPKTVRGTAGLALGIALGMAGCEGAEAKVCRGQYLATHAVVQATNLNEFDSVEQGLKAVTETLEACQKAGLTPEIEQLKKVHAKLESNFNHLRKHGKPTPLSPAELETLVKNGDPKCPKGQSYTHRASNQQIRCMGAHPVDMGWAEVAAFYTRRGFKLYPQGSQLKAEYGSESYTFEYGSENDSKPARCVRVFAPPGTSWQESVALLTGVQPQRLQEGKPVKTAHGVLPLSHTPDETQAIYQLGNCAAANEKTDD